MYERILGTWIAEPTFIQQADITSQMLIIEQVDSNIKLTFVTDINGNMFKQIYNTSLSYQIAMFPKSEVSMQIKLEYIEGSIKILPDQVDLKLDNGLIISDQDQVYGHYIKLSGAAN
jgi:hypothetical protein